MLGRLMSLLAERGRLAAGRLFAAPADLAEACDGLLAETGARVQYAADAADVTLNGEAVDGLLLAVSGRLARVAAHCVVDATSAAVIASRAGAPYEHAAAAESPPPTVIAFRAVGVDGDAYADGGREAVVEILRGADRPDALDAAALEVIVPPEGANVEAWVYATVSPAADLTEPAARAGVLQAARRLSRAAAEVLVRRVAGFGEARFVDAAPHVGTADCRRIIAPVRLAAEHLTGDDSWPDALGLIAARRAEASGDADGWHPPAGIPYRCFVPERVDGLLVAGGCISAVCPSPPALRSGLAAVVTGQVACVAAALSARRSRSPRTLSAEQIGRHLSDQGAVLP